MLPCAGPALREGPPPLAGGEPRRAQKQIPYPPITSSADAIFISCTNYRTNDITERLEEEFREPVVSSNPATFWAALRTIGCRERIRGFRKVLREFENGR